MPSTAISDDWARTLVDAAAFEREQSRLECSWTFLGLTHDVRKDGDWFRSSIATRSVFVQRFGGALVGFENRCAHRSYPLRDAPRGRGPIVCRFHGWRYDERGNAVGIPMCSELFRATPTELKARLRPVEIQTCGSLIFGRFARAGADDTLPTFLGEAFPILEALSDFRFQPTKFSREIAANWRLCMHISLDDYHIATVHPSTFRRVTLKEVNYLRFGLHSLYTRAKNADYLAQMSIACRQRTFAPTDYCIFHIVPNLFVVLFHARSGLWYCLVHVFDPIAQNRSMLRAWLYPVPLKTVGAARHVLSRALSPIVGIRVRRVLREDSAISERIQKVARQIDAAPRLGALEVRIGWFEESYRKLTTGFAAPRQS